jgi:hypothetical protein
MGSTTSGASGKARTNKQTVSLVDKQVVRQYITDYIKNNFASTLGTVPNIVNYVMAMTQHESAFTPSAHGPQYGQSYIRALTSTYPATAKVYNQGSALQRANIINYAAAFGLIQCKRCWSWR